MPLPVNYVPAKGDVLNMRATVRDDFDPAEDKFVWVDLKGHYQPLMVRLEDFESIAYVNFQPGDTVRHFSATVGTVVARIEEKAWVQTDHADVVWPCCELSRVEVPNAATDHDASDLAGEPPVIEPPPEPNDPLPMVAEAA
jgi:hypothetical protein